MFVDPEELIPSAETARLLNLKEQTLSSWRCQGRGPKYCRIGRAIFYRREDIRAWLGQQLRSPGEKNAA